MRNWRNKKGFTLIELLIVVAIIGIIAAIAIPNLLSAIQRSKQKRTMSDMRSMGTGLGSYQVDYNGYPSAGAFPGAVTTAFPFLDPNYIVNPPTKDGWRTMYGWTDGPVAVTPWVSSYTLTSFGKDLTGSDVVTSEITRYFDCDIIYQDGQFQQSPEGIQKS